MATKQEVIDHLIKVAKKEDGVQEHPKGSNRGSKVDLYQKADSLGGVGYAWCGSFVAWCIRATEDDLKVDIPWNYSASTNSILQWGLDHEVVHESPQPGDVMIVVSPQNRSHAHHTGLVLTVDSNHFTTEEGNTNKDGGREGYGVMSQKRDNGDRYRFVRPFDLMKFETEPQKAFTVIIGTRKLPVYLIGNAGYVGVRDWGESLGFTVEWNTSNQCPVYDGRDALVECKKVETTVVGPLRRLAELAGLDLVLSGDTFTLKRAVPLTKGDGA